jgi:uncharacterized damage-inducible protein DinB
MQDSPGTKGTVASQISVPRTSIRGELLSQVLQDETRHRQDLLSCLQELGNVPDGKHPVVDWGIGDPHDQR